MVDMTKLLIEKKMGWSVGNAVKSWLKQLEAIRNLPETEKR